MARFASFGDDLTTDDRFGGDLLVDDAVRATAADATERAGHDCLGD